MCGSAFAAGLRRLVGVGVELNQPVDVVSAGCDDDPPDQRQQQDNPLPGTPLLSRALIAAGRSLLASAYTRTYRRGSSPLRRTRSWLLVHAAARLSEGIPAERDMLIGRLERARRRTAGQLGS